MCEVVGILCVALGTRMGEPQDGYRKTAVVVVVVVVFTLNHSFYPTTSAVHPVYSSLRDTNYVVTD